MDVIVFEATYIDVVIKNAVYKLKFVQLRSTEI